MTSRRDEGVAAYDNAYSNTLLNELSTGIIFFSLKGLSYHPYSCLLSLCSQFAVILCTLLHILVPDNYAEGPSRDSL